MQSVNNYQYIDHSPSRGSNYYRLKQVDIDNGYSYSIVQKVTFDPGGFTWKIIQNPVVNELRVSLESDQSLKLKYHVIDAGSSRLLITGEKAFTQGRSILQMPLTNLANGMYILTIISGKQTVTKLFMKQ